MIDEESREKNAEEGNDENVELEGNSDEGADQSAATSDSEGSQMSRQQCVESCQACDICSCIFNGAILDLDSPSVEGIQPNGPNNQRSEPFNTETVSDSTSESGNVDNGNLNTGFPAREASDGASTDGIGNDNVGFLEFSHRVVVRS